MARATLLSPAVLAKLDLYLSKQGYSQGGGPGGGKNTVHVATPLLAHWCIGLTAPQISKAGEVVREAYNCMAQDYVRRRVEHVCDEAGRPTGQLRITETPVFGSLETAVSLVDWVKRRIEDFALKTAAERAMLLDLPEAWRSRIIMEFEPLRARAEIWDGGGEMTVYHFNPRIRSEMCVGRSQAIAHVASGASFPLTLLIVAGGILADGWEKSGGQLPFPGQEGVSSTTPSEPGITTPKAAGNEKTPGLPQPRVSRNTNRPKKSQAGPTSTPENKCASLKRQAPMRLQPVGQHGVADHHEARP